jgi:hypothetical protein
VIPGDVEDWLNAVLSTRFRCQSPSVQWYGNPFIILVLCLLLHLTLVAMTRAQALLIVVGDPGVLFLDPLWRCFLNYIHRSGGWKGKAIHWNPLNDESEVDFLKEREDQAKNMMDSLLERLKDHVLDGREGDEAIERPWREDE